MREELQSKYFREGHLVTIPKKAAAKQELFAYLQEELVQQGQVFTEKEVNDFLKQFYTDYAILRRYMVDYGYLVRDDYGKEYRIGDRNGYLDETL